MKIKNIRFILCKIIIFTVIVFTSCGKSNPTAETSADTTSTGGSAKILSFAASGSPLNNSVYLEKVSISNDQITLAIKVKGGVDVYGAIMEVTYDSSKIKYESSASGNFLGGEADILFYPSLVNGQEGRLHIAIDKKSAAVGSNGDGILATIILKALTGQTNTSISFDTTICNLMPSTSNTPIPGTTWLGGSLSYQ